MKDDMIECIAACIYLYLYMKNIVRLVKTPIFHSAAFSRHLYFQRLYPI